MPGPLLPGADRRRSETCPGRASVASGARAPRPFGGRRRVERQGMDRAAHRTAEGAIDELVARDRAQALELLGHDERGEVDAVVARDPDGRPGQRDLDLSADLLRRHGGILRAAGRPVYDAGQPRITRTSDE